MDDVLLAFSGGKDSFLAACRLIDQKYRVHLITFDNGSEMMMDNVLHGVKRLQAKFSDKVVIWQGFYKTTGIIPLLSDHWRQAPMWEFAEDYPALTNCHLTCLICQSAMWNAGIAYCQSHTIHYYATGYKSTDEFCTGMSEWVDGVSAFAKKHGVTTLFPLWEGISDFDRDTAMISYGFQPAVLEPKCCLGCWPAEKMSDDVRGNIMAYFNGVLLPVMEDRFDQYADIFRHILLDKSTEDNAEVRSFRAMRAT